MSIKQKIHEVKFLDTNKTFKFENGETIDNLKIAYTINGRLNIKKDNAILICHAFTGDSNVALWWSNFVGKNKAIDINKYFVICSNVLEDARELRDLLLKNQMAILIMGRIFQLSLLKIL